MEYGHAMQMQRFSASSVRIFRLFTEYAIDQNLFMDEKHAGLFYSTVVP